MGNRHPFAPSFKKPRTRERRFSYRPLPPSSSGTAWPSVRVKNSTESEWRLFAGPLHPLPFANEDAEIAGAIRADLEASGKPIGAYDLLIAGQAMRNKLTLVTANLSEFARIKALAWTDWGKPELQAENQKAWMSGF
jgi:hypothetical protein